MNIPFIQQKITVLTAKELSELLETKVQIGRINPGFLNRIIIDDLLIEDQSGDEMCKVTRLSVKFEILPLLVGDISIGSVQLFGFNIQLNRLTPQSDPNFKFVLDALASDSKKNTNLDLRINSLLIRRGKFSYDILSERETPGKFNLKHLKLYNIIGNISLKSLQKDSINAQIKRLSLDEQSGFELHKLSLKILGNEQNMLVENFTVDLPGTSLTMDTLKMHYDSMQSFNNFMTDVHFSFKMLPSYFTPHDISSFVPALEHFKEKVKIKFEANGTIDQLECPSLLISANNHLVINGNVSLQDLSKWEDAYIYGNLSNLSADRRGVDFLVRNLSKEYEDTPGILKRLGNVSFRGQISGYFNDLVTFGTVSTELGQVRSDLKFSSNREKNIISYSGGVKTENFEIGKLLDNDKLGKISLDFKVNTTHSNEKYPDILLKGLISTVDYSDYQYNNITLDGEYKQGGFNGKMILDDINGSFFLNGSFNLNKKVPSFDFLAEINNIHPYKLNLLPDRYKDNQVSMKIRANFVGGSINEMIGSINIDSLLFSSPEKDYFMNNFQMLSTRKNQQNTLTVKSEFIDARVEGNYNYRTLLNSTLNTIRQNLPSLLPEDKKKPKIANKNNVIFDVDIYNTEVLSEIFDLPITIKRHSTIKGFLNDNLGKMKIEGYFPALKYGNNNIESGQILCENVNGYLKGRIRMSNHKKNGITNLSVNIQGKDDQLDMRVNWGNSGSTTYTGDFVTVANFSRTHTPINSSLLKAIIKIEPTEVILNDVVWNILPSEITVDSGRVHIDNFLFRHQNQFLHIDGYASEALQDTIKVDMKDINIGYVFDVVNLKGVDFGGHVTGNAIACRTLNKPILNTRLSVNDFTFNEALLGNMDVHGEWHEQEEGIYLNAHIQEGEVAEAFVDGYIYPLKPKSGVDLNIKASNINSQFAELYLKDIVSNISGRTSGKIHFYGQFSALNLEGVAQADVKLKVNALETYFELKDTIHFSKNEISLKKSNIYDLEGHPGVADGYLRHQNFKNINYKLNFDSRNMLVMRTTNFSEMPFYGTIYATGNASLTGNDKELNVDAVIQTNANTFFVYSMASTMYATSNQFIKFRDKTPHKIKQESLLQENEFHTPTQQQEEELDLKMNIQIDATPDATVKIIMDPVADDHITAKGTGSIHTDFFNKGDVKMFGTYKITQGVYKFSLQEVIRKDFLIKENSNVIFNGNPYDAMLNVQTIHTVNSASLRDLIPDEQSGLKDNNVNVRVNCLMNLLGPLTHPNIKLGIELPNERDEIQALVKNNISTEEEINMQFLYLLSLGKFYPPTHLNIEQNSNVMSSVLSSTLSGQLNRMLSHILDNNNNWSIGTNLSTGDKGWTDVEVQGVLSGQLLNNRLLINGNFGYRDNPLATTNFVGDFEAEWLLTRAGDIRLKAYNQTNNRYYTRTSLTTQGIGIMYKKSFDKWNEFFFRRKRGRKEKSLSQPMDTLQKDSISWITIH